jgi:hypothetical protein
MSPPVQQLDMFGAVAPSTSIIGLTAILPKPCHWCGANSVMIGSSRAMHHARLDCSECGRHRGWASGEAVLFLQGIIDHFGRPDQPVIVRGGSFVSGLTSFAPGT